VTEQSKNQNRIAGGLGTRLTVNGGPSATVIQDLLSVIIYLRIATAMLP